MDLRDEGREVLGGVSGGQSKEVVYTRRAVTAGAFTLPPVEAEAMYNPEVWTRAPGGSVRVLGSWDGFYL